MTVADDKLRELIVSALDSRVQRQGRELAEMIAHLSAVLELMQNTMALVEEQGDAVIAEAAMQCKDVDRMIFLVGTIMKLLMAEQALIMNPV